MHIRERLLSMLQMQDEMNRRVHPRWRTQPFRWQRAIWVECAEMLEHYGWKWWQKTDGDLRQVRLELIDIWHFGLSLLMLECADRQRLAARLTKALADARPPSDYRRAIEQLAAAAIADDRFDLECFAALLAGIDFSFADLYKHYVGKNTLNCFRQDRGYREGRYRKQWQGREDNEHLLEAIDATADGDDFPERLYMQLSRRYEACG